MILKDYYTEAENAEYKPITFGLYNKIDDDLIPQIWSKMKGEVFGIDDFVYATLALDNKEQFLLKMHNKEIMTRIMSLKKKYDNQQVVVDVDYNNGTINVIKLKHIKN